MMKLPRIKQVFVECSRSKDSEEMDRFGIRNKYRNVKRSMIMKHSFQDFVSSYGGQVDRVAVGQSGIWTLRLKCGVEFGGDYCY